MQHSINTIRYNQEKQTYKITTRKKNCMREFLKGGALSVGKLIVEKAPP